MKTESGLNFSFSTCVLAWWKIGKQVVQIYLWRNNYWASWGNLQCCIVNHSFLWAFYLYSYLQQIRWRIQYGFSNLTCWVQRLHITHKILHKNINNKSQLFELWSHWQYMLADHLWVLSARDAVWQWDNIWIMTKSLIKCATKTSQAFSL